MKPLHTLTLHPSQPKSVEVHLQTDLPNIKKFNLFNQTKSELLIKIEVGDTRKSV
jgi:hypothetical protein